MLPPQQMDDQDTCFCWACDVSFLQLFIHHLETFRENVLCLGWPNAGESKNVQYPNFVGLYPHYIIYLHPNDIAISRDMILPSSPFRLWVNLGLFAHCSNPPKSYQVWKLFNICSLLEWPLNPCANPPENLGPNSQELERGTRTQFISFHLGLGTGAGRALSRKWAVMIPRTVPTSIGGVFQPSTNTTNMEIEPTKSTNIHM